nr:MAG TPA: hypothetical protein [Caudoviricetes sp.]
MIRNCNFPRLGWMLVLAMASNLSHFIPSVRSDDLVQFSESHLFPPDMIIITRIIRIVNILLPHHIKKSLVTGSFSETASICALNFLRQKIVKFPPSLVIHRFFALYSLLLQLPKCPSIRHAEKKILIDLRCYFAHGILHQLLFLSQRIPAHGSLRAGIIASGRLHALFIVGDGLAGVRLRAKLLHPVRILLRKVQHRQKLFLRQIIPVLFAQHSVLHFLAPYTHKCPEKDFPSLGDISVKWQLLVNPFRNVHESVHGALLP